MNIPKSPRFDAPFIERHQLIDRYLEDKLPVKGARDLENWCRAHPEYVDALNLSGRAQTSLRLLEAIGRPVDLREPSQPWWKTPYLSMSLGLITLASLVALWFSYGKYELVRGELHDAQTRLRQGSLVQPAIETSLHVAPDHTAAMDRARVPLNTKTPQLIDLHIDVGYLKDVQFRVVVDKKDQGRALVINNLIKDSNGELRVTINSSGLSLGLYTVRIEAMPLRGIGGPTAEGWFSLEVQ